MGKYVEYHKIVNFTSNGDLGISSNVIASITKEAVNEVEGASIANPHTLFGKKAVDVKFNKKGELFIDCEINVAYGYNVKDICANVQDRIEHNLLYMTEIKTTRVNVNVSSVAA